MTPLVVAGTVALFVLTAVVAYGERRRWLASQRLADIAGFVAELPRESQAARRSRAFPPRYRSVPVSLACIAAALFRVTIGMPIEVSIAVGVLLGVLAYLLEDYVAQQRAATIEAQLASAIDLLVGSLRAGSSLLAAFESALQEADPPLRPYLQEVAGRIRLGDDPRVAVSDLPVYVPLENFRLFATSLAIHWEVGGSLSTTLSTVGRTVRDRVELARRVRAQGVEAHASVAVVFFLAYALGFLMWRSNPDRLETLIRTSVGTELVAGAILLQAIGLVWMSRLSRSAF